MQSFLFVFFVEQNVWCLLFLHFQFKLFIFSSQLKLSHNPIIHLSPPGLLNTAVVQVVTTLNVFADVKDHTY